jgi:NADP-dependent 3-hydroxy acid dehydrogenase YdfG
VALGGEPVGEVRHEQREAPAPRVRRTDERDAQAPVRHASILPVGQDADMVNPLDGTVALVTGASSGIGEQTAATLAGLGAAVVVAARRVDRLDALVQRIGDAGGRAVAVAADVTDEDQAHAAVAAAVDRFGRLDTVVANAGVMLLGPIVDADTTEWRRMLELNTLGAMYTAHAALPHLLAAAEQDPRNIADLVITSSVAGRQVRQGSGVYNASKHAVGAFAEALRMEVTQRHVRVSLIEPGAVATELASHNRPEVQEQIQQRFEGGDRLQADDIARTIAFVVTSPRHMAVNEVLIRPTWQV